MCPAWLKSCAGCFLCRSALLNDWFRASSPRPLSIMRREQVVRFSIKANGGGAAEWERGNQGLMALAPTTPAQDDASELISPPTPRRSCSSRPPFPISSFRPYSDSSSVRIWIFKVSIHCGTLTLASFAFSVVINILFA